MDYLLDEKEKKLKKKITKSRMLSIFDVFIALFVVTPLVVSFWRGTWSLMNIYAVQFPEVNSFFAGNFVHFGFLLVQDLLNDILDKQPTIWNKIRSQVIRKCYIYMFAIACIMTWRAGWIILDTLCDNRQFYIALVAGICFLIVILLKGIRNCLAVPMIILIDYENVVFTFPTRFRMKVSYF